MLLVALDGKYPKLFQDVLAKLTPEVYLKGPDAADEAVWREIVRHCLFLRHDPTVPIVLLTTTRPALDALASTDRARLDQTLSESGGLTLDQLLGRYGDSDDQWRPFGSDTSIADYLR